MYLTKNDEHYNIYIGPDIQNIDVFNDEFVFSQFNDIITLNTICFKFLFFLYVKGKRNYNIVGKFCLNLKLISGILTYPESYI